MPKIYCPDCGTPMEHSGIKPKFCSNCGVDLETQIANIPASQTVASVRRQQGRVPVGRRPIIQYEEEAFQSDGTLPDIQKLDIEISIPQAHRETVGEIWASEPSPENIAAQKNIKRGRGRPKNIMPVITLDRKGVKEIDGSEALNKFTNNIFNKTVIDLNPNQNE